MNSPIRRKPQPGDTVKVGSLPDVFEVIEHHGSTVLLQSRHGIRLRAGINVVYFAESNTEAAA